MQGIGWKIRINFGVLLIIRGKIIKSELIEWSYSTAVCLEREGERHRDSQENILLSIPCRLWEIFSRKAECSRESLMEKPVEGISQRNAAYQEMGQLSMILYKSWHIYFQKLSWKEQVKSWLCKNSYFEIKMAFNTSQEGVFSEFPFPPWIFLLALIKGVWGGSGSEQCPHRQ